MKRIRMCSVILALILAMTVIFAFPQQAQAANVKMNVITRIDTDSYDQSYYTFKYNSKGLVTKKSWYQYGRLAEQATYKYNSNNLVKSIDVRVISPPNPDMNFKITNRYDKNRTI